MNTEYNDYYLYQDELELAKAFLGSDWLLAVPALPIVKRNTKLSLVDNYGTSSRGK